MKTIVMIPSRYGSSRFKGKPLALIKGKPMIQRVYERAVNAKNISDVRVVTDDPRIFNTVEKFGGRAMMTSPENRSGTARAAEAAEKIGLAPDDIIINVQGDQPLIDPRCIEQTAAPLLSERQNPESQIRMTTLGFRIVNPDEITNPKDVKVTFDNNGNALYFSRSPIPYARDPSLPFDTYRHLGIYGYTRGFLEVFRKLPQGRLEQIEKLEQLRVLEHGYKIMVVITEYDSPEIDLPEDIARVERLIQE